jgi:hypothetical protein
VKLCRRANGGKPAALASHHSNRREERHPAMKTLFLAAALSATRLAASASDRAGGREALNRAASLGKHT